MAKKIRFPLEMKDGVEVRTIEELRENFCLTKVIEYHKNGKLVIWLRDRYAIVEADAIDEISCDDENMAEKICNVFDIPYDEKVEATLEKETERAKRVEILKQYTDDDKYVAVIDNVAFDQDELYDLLDEGIETIYLCGDKFSIPLSKSSITYIGVNNPTVVIDSKVEVDWNEKQIILENVAFDEKYQAVADSAKATKAEFLRFFVEKLSNIDNFKLYKKVVDALQSTSANTTNICEYDDTTYLNFLIPPSEKLSVRNTFDKVKNGVSTLNYNADKNIKQKKQLASNIIGLAESYLSNI